jgi:hypothetical protein
MSTEPEVAELKSPILTPVLSARCALRIEHLLVTGLFATLFLALNYIPLRNTDLWSHVEYGKWILAHAALPAFDPWLPLAEGMPVVDTAWLAQAALAQMEIWCGVEGLSGLFAVTVWLSYLLLARTFYLQTGRLGLATFGTVLAIAVGWSRFATIRPENFSMLALTTLAWLLARDRRLGAFSSLEGNVETSARWTTWFAVPLLFAVWANLHGTFVCGLAVLGCFAAGRLIEVAWYTRSLPAVLADRTLRRWVVLTELAAAATLINPYGIDLWLEVVRFSTNPILRDMSEWNPLVILNTGGYEFALATIVLVVLLRHSRRSVRPVDVLLLGLFAFAAVSQMRMMGWLAPIFTLVVMPHVADIWNRLRPARPNGDELIDQLPPGELPPGRSWRISLACVMLVWITFAFSGFGTTLLGGKARSAEKLYSEGTPLKLTQYLREHPPTGQIFNPQWWGDWLIWDGPAGIRPFANTQVHLLPVNVWRDYRRISLAEPGWEAVLDRYNIDLMVIDKENQPEIATVLKKNTNWSLRFDEENAQVFVRGKKSAPAPNKVATKQ